MSRAHVPSVTKARADCHQNKSLAVIKARAGYYQGKWLAVTKARDQYKFDNIINNSIIIFSKDDKYTF